MLTRLHPRIDSVLAQALDDAVRTAIEAELPALRERLRVNLTQALDDIVTRAISNELERLYAARQKQD